MIRPLALIACIALAACSGRPGPATLMPVADQSSDGTHRVSVVTVTNRAPDADRPGTFGGATGSRATYLRYEVSIPPGHESGNIEWPGDRVDPSRHFAVRKQSAMTARDFERLIRGREVGLYVHGYNTRYQEAIFRIAQLSTDSHVDGMPILFSWPSNGHAGAYLADRDSSDASRATLADLLIRMTAGRSANRPVTVLAHSMGGRLTMEALARLRRSGRDDVLDRIELVLAAPDIDIILFQTHMTEIGRMRHPVTVLVSTDDPALRLSTRLAAGRKRLGMVDVRDPMVLQLIGTYGIRVIDITELPTDDPAHRRYVGLLSSMADTNPQDFFTGARRVGAFVFNGIGGVFQEIGNTFE